MENVET